MGYYTNFEVEIFPKNPELYQHFIDEYYIGEDTKWYSYDTDCKRISKSDYPNTLIILSGVGEESGDIWKKAFLNGEIVWEWKLDATIPDVPKEIYNLIPEEK
jgi:hypothetical protein